MVHEFSGTLGEIVDSGVIAVMRGADPDTVVDVANALIAGGVTALELTADSDHVLQNVRAVRESVADDAIVGVGTVYDDRTTRDVIDAGASFVVSPTVEQDVVEASTKRGVVAIPGAFTPTEVITAARLGADAVKVFPAASAGPRHLSHIAGPLPDIPLIPTGGVTLETTTAYIEAGAIAVGIGGSLLDQTLLAARDFDAIAERAEAFVGAVDEGRM